MKYINEWKIDDFQKHIRKFINSNITVKSVEIAGEGNMNFAYRVKTDNESFIIKQAPPFCAKFESIPAPIERIESELHYYDLVNKEKELAAYSPQILGRDLELNIFYMNDLGSGSDYEFLYESGKTLAEEKGEILVKYLYKLHSIDTKNTHFKNTKMRELNYEYIFSLPFDAENKSIDLNTITMGLEEVCLKYKNDKKLKEIAKDLGSVYWKDTQTLIHGDYYPRSWLETEKGLSVIDPEFAFYGVAEFDLSVMLAHAVMSEDFENQFNLINEFYGPYDKELTIQLTAIEVFRRVMFVSQLPIKNDLEFKKEILARSYQALLTKNAHSFLGENNV